MIRKLFASHNQELLTREMRAEGCWGGGSEGCEDTVGDYVYEFRTTGVHTEVGVGSCRGINPGRIRQSFSSAAVTAETRSVIGEKKNNAGGGRTRETG